MDTSKKDLFTASTLFLAIIIVMIGASWLFNPATLVFSEDFENNERNQQYIPCAAFTIEQGHLRVTVAESHSGCAVRLPNVYKEFTFTTSVYPVKEVYDGSINIIFNQTENEDFEIQLRPNNKQFNFIATKTNASQGKYVEFTSGWIDVPDLPFNNDENKMTLTVTEKYFNFWFNDFPVYAYINEGENLGAEGIIKIGAGAGNQGGIAFEFDNIKIYEEDLYSKWSRDLEVKRSLKLVEEYIAENGQNPP